MIQVLFQAAGKRFRKKWVFKGLDLSFDPGQRYVILGKNGSGKSTLLRMAAGYLTPTCGRIEWYDKGRIAEPDSVYARVSLTSPSLELPEEFSFPEIINFHKQFKAFPGNLTTSDVVRYSGLQDFNGKSIKEYSSGMKQRVKLVLAILPETKLLLLDEPCTNLDKESRAWYKLLLEEYGAGKTVVVASNHNPEEYTNDFIAINL